MKHTKNTKFLGFQKNLQTADLQDLICTTIGVDNDLTIPILYLYLIACIRDPETLRMFNESIKNWFTLTFDSWTIDRQTIRTGIVFQLDLE